jgi:hypothetical protein
MLIEPRMETMTSKLILILIGVLLWVDNSTIHFRY